MRLAAKKNKFLIILIAVSSYIIVSCERGAKNREKGVMYTCPMHPEIRKNEPGTCPICKMQLVPEERKTETLAVDDLLGPTNSYVVSDIESVRPVRSLQQHSLAIHGTIAYDERLTNSVAARVNGRIEKLYLKYRFQEIKAGQRLFDLYSPELLNEQQNFIFLLRNEDQKNVIVEAARNKLKLLGLTSEQIKQIENTRKTIDPVPFFSPYSGHLHISAADATAEAMGSMPSGADQGNRLASVLFKEGMYVTSGQVIFQINSTEKVWALLNLGLREVPMVKTGDPVEIRVKYDTLDGMINFIEPALRNGQSFVSARVYLDNSSYRLKIGENITAVLKTSSKEAVMLPSSAIVSLGLRSIAFVKQGNRYVAREIQTGPRSGGMVQVISGLDSTTVVAKNASFLVDSESFVLPND